jgi:anthranilate 1,2-dioxygenase ferredoxin reductase component
MPQRFLIIGAGPAGMRAAEILRGGDANAEITLIGDEPHLPYDRPPLSKAFLTESLEAVRLHLKPEDFYRAERITLRLGIPALRIDRAAKVVELAEGAPLPYDKLLIATGCRSRRLPPAFDHAPVLYLRSLADAERIRAALRPGLATVLIGGGFIGLEIAASARKLGAAVTVLEMAPRLLSRGMPPVVSTFVHALHERHGVRIELSARLSGMLHDQRGRLEIATEHAAYPCDLVIAGIGAQPNTELAAAAGLPIEDGICVDEHGQTVDPDIFAAGDATRHLNPLLGQAIRVESWQVALNQAAVVARNMLGAREAYAELPWLWTDQYDCNIQTLGRFTPALEQVVRGDPAGPAFTVLGLNAQGRLAAAVTVNSGRDMAILRRLAALPKPLAKAALADPATKLADLLKAARAS